MSAQRLLAFLALHERPLHRVYVAGTLWIDASEDRAAANLRSSLWRLHQPGYKLVEATNLQLRLAPEIPVDVREMRAVAHKLLMNPESIEEREIDLHEASLTGELLPDWYDDWVFLERESLRQLSLHALEALGEHLLGNGRLGPALEAGLAAVGSDPLRESSHRLLIKVHLAEGNAGEAIRQFRFCQRLLRQELGLEPSRQLVELVQDLTT